MRMDPVKEWNRQYDLERRRDEEVSALAIKKTESHMKHGLDYEDVRNTFDRIWAEEDFFQSIADCLRRNQRDRLYDMLFAACESDVFMWKTSEAAKEVHEGVTNEFDL